MSLPAARVSDLHSCPICPSGAPPHVGGPIAPPGVESVIIEGMAAAVATGAAVCAGAVDTIAAGSASVYIGGLPAARFGDPTAHGGAITGGAATVEIG